jgi:flagellar M-ring protein FliF
MKAILDGLKTLGPTRLAALAVVTVAMLGLIGVLMARGGTERMALLYADLDMRDAAQISDRLEAQHIPHQAAGDGSQIMVPADQVTRARLLLAKDALPSGGSIGYEIFDRGDGFTSNEFQQNINQLRALEGELERTIRSVNGVRAARVHLVLPKREPFSRDKQEAQASVLLTTVGAGRLDRETVQALVTLVAAAVPGLRPQNVAVIDNRGNLLARAGELSAPAMAAQTTEDLRLAMEARLAHAVEAMLEPSLGAGHVRAEATVDADFDKFSESKETYDPDGQVVRSTQTTSDASKSSEASAAVSVQNNLPNADAGAPAAGNQDQKQEETTNYEIGKTVRTIAREQAQIHRISVAVMVDGTEQRAPDGTTTWQPRSAEELDRISKLVKTAIGFDEKRGDQVDVASMRFAVADEALPAPTPGMLGSVLDRTDLVHLAQTVLVGLVAITVLLLIVRPMVVRITTMPTTALGTDHSRAVRALSGPTGIAGLSGHGGAAMQLLTGPGGDGPAHAGGDNLLADESMVAVASIEGQLRASSLRRLGDLVEKHPEESIAIVRTWMQQEAS